MTFYRVKLRVRVPDDPKATDKLRRQVHDLIEKHGGNDDSAHRPSAAFMAGVFRDRVAAKGFREEARAVLKRP